jgi:hypothetical protein
VWKLLDQRYATTRIGRGLWTEDSLRHDVMEVRNGMLVMRPGSPLARLFAGHIPLEFEVGGIRIQAYCTPGQRDDLKARLDSICSYPVERRAY